MPAAACIYPALMIRGVKLSPVREGEHVFVLPRETGQTHSRQRLRLVVREARREMRGLTREAACSELVMPGLVPGIHVLGICREQDVDGRDEPGHDGKFSFARDE